MLQRSKQHQAVHKFCRRIVGQKTFQTIALPYGEPLPETLLIEGTPGAALPRMTSGRRQMRRTTPEGLAWPASRRAGHQ
jgi:hypothetical protein